MLIFLFAISFRHRSLSVKKETLNLGLVSHKEQLLEKNLASTLNNQEILERFKEKFNLTQREMEVFNYIIQGKNNKEIAKELHLTEATIKYHCSKLFYKTSVKNRGQLTALFNSIT